MADSPRTTFDEDRRSYAEKLAKLEFENNALKTEKRLLDQSKESMKNRYEDLLKKKNDEISGLQSNFDYVFHQRKQLQSKLENQKDVAGKHSKDSVSETTALKKEVKDLKAQLDKYQRQYNSLNGKAEHLRLDLNRELMTNDQYRERLALFEKEIKRLSDLNEDLVDRLQQAKNSSAYNSASTRVNDLQRKLDALQKTNTSLQSRVDQLLQHKISVELLKQKNDTLVARAERLEDAERRASALETARLELEARFNQYFGFLSQNISESDNTDHTEVSDDDKILNFVRNYKSLQNKNLVLYDKLNETLASLTDANANTDFLMTQINDELKPQILLLETKIKEKDADIAELQKVKLLNRREIDFLRKSLKDLDKVSLTKQKNPAAHPEESKKEDAKANATNQYLTNLEKLVDDYKKEIDNLRQQQNTAGTSAIPSVPSKRPRLTDEQEDTTMQSITKIRNENVQLLSEIKGLKDEIKELQSKVDVYKASAEHKGPSILELRKNPFNKDQLIKQETLDLLRNENEALIQKYVQNQDLEDQIPRAIFARQENDKDNLQAKIDQLNKKISRLNTVYADKSKKIMAIIARYFGYSVEFVPSPLNPNDFCSKIKFFSRMWQSTSETDVPYLTVDVHSKDLKAHGNYEFRTLCADLVNQWVSEKDLIPCFLSALNLRLHQEANEKVSS